MNSSKALYRICECGEEVYSEPCKCGKDGTEGMQALIEEITNARPEIQEQRLADLERAHHERQRREVFAEGKKRGRSL